MQPAITVGTVSYYSTAHLLHLFDSLEHTTTGSKLNYLVCDNTDGRDTQLYEALGSSARIIPFAPANPRRAKRERASGSYTHGLGLNRLLQEVETDLCLVCDPDCLMLARGWDVLCCSLLSQNGVAAVGTPHHSRKLAKYHGFPSPIWILFSTVLFRQIGADWTPYTDAAMVAAWDQVRRLLSIVGGWSGERLMGQRFYGTRTAWWMRAMFGGSSKDTGWKIPAAVAAQGYRAELLTPATAAHQITAPLRGELAVMELADEFELYLYAGIPLVTHYHGVRHRQAGDVQASTRLWHQLAASVAHLNEEADVATTLMDLAGREGKHDGDVQT
ncbi:MAG: hypothetical protein JXA93_24890 [Anaerolineae bacterium]|nr:hypothetical protein [Anaerolineae bacterium]